MVEDYLPRVMRGFQALMPPGAIPDMIDLQEEADRCMDYAKIEAAGRVSLSTDQRRRLGFTAAILFWMLRRDLDGRSEEERDKNRKALLRVARDFRRCIRSLRDHRSLMWEKPIPELVDWTLETIPAHGSGVFGDSAEGWSMPVLWGSRGIPHEIDDALELIAFICTEGAVQKRGRRKEEELHFLIDAVYQTFKNAGGKGTVYWDSYANDRAGGYNGPLLDMVSEVLDQIEFQYTSRDALAQAIRAVIAEK